MSKRSNQTESLEKLIKLKRWEEPPPGHLDRLSSRIIAQIEADQVLSKDSFWTRVAGFLDFKPVLACTYSAAAMGLLVVGLGMREDVETPQTVQQSTVPGFKLTGMHQNPSEPEPNTSNFRLPSSPGMWRNGDPAMATAPSGTSPMIIYSSVPSNASIPLGAQLSRQGQSLVYPVVQSNQVAQPTRLSR